MLLYPMSKVNKKKDINNLLINFIWRDIKKKHSLLSKGQMFYIIY